MTTVILLTGCLGGLLAYRWAYDEAIETQDSVLIQIGAFAQKENFNRCILRYYDARYP
jgi:hypothetical protein